MLHGTFLRFDELHSGRVDAHATLSGMSSAEIEVHNMRDKPCNKNEHSSKLAL